MAENYREFNAGNNTEESEDKKTKKTSGNNQCTQLGNKSKELLQRLEKREML